MARGLGAGGESETRGTASIGGEPEIHGKAAKVKGKAVEILAKQAESEGEAPTGVEEMESQGGAEVESKGDAASRVESARRGGDRGMQPAERTAKVLVARDAPQGDVQQATSESPVDPLRLRPYDSKSDMQMSKDQTSLSTEGSENVQQDPKIPKSQAPLRLVESVEDAKRDLQMSKDQTSLSTEGNTVQNVQRDTKIAKSQAPLRLVESDTVVDAKPDIQMSKDHTSLSTEGSDTVQVLTLNIEKMEKRVQELEMVNAKLRQRLLDVEMEKAAANISSGFDANHKKCHDIFVCPNESGFSKLKIVLDGPVSKMIHSVHVHGKLTKKKFKELNKDLKKFRKELYVPPHQREGKNQAPEDFKRLTPLGKLVLLGIIEDIYRLHRRGLCLDGQFTLESFYWTDEKKVKLDPSLILIPHEGRRSCMIKDYHQIFKIIMEILSLHNEPVPSDLKCLLDLLSCDDPVLYEDIIRYNISLMTEIAKKSHFITLFDRWLQMVRNDQKKRDDDKEAIKKLVEEGKNSEAEKEKAKQDAKILPPVWQRKSFRTATRSPKTSFTKPEGVYDSDRVLEFIPVVYGEELWPTLVCDNTYVSAVFDRRFIVVGRPLKDPEDLLIVWRNALTHLLDSSLDGDDIKYFDEDIVNMLESCVPGVFNNFQRGMHAVGHEELPHLIRMMRM